jgi:isoquinoline 1-oxidoreductase beta subunit
MTVTRRAFLRTTATTSAGLILGFHLPLRASETAAGFRPNAFLAVSPNDKVTLWITRQEMGQGVRTILPAILADELDADWNTIRFEQAQPGGMFKNIRLRTSGSGSAAGTWMPLRVNAARAREMLTTAAAQRWGVPASECRTESGAVIHTASGRSLRYGALAADAAKLEPPKEPKLKPVAALRRVGKTMARTDGPHIVKGKAVYGSDVRLPGMKYAVMARCPVLRGKVRSVDDRRARAVPGVSQIIPISAGISHGVAVVADNTWAAMKGRDALDIQWEPGAHAEYSTEGNIARLQAALDQPGWFSRDDGNAPAAMAKATKQFEQTYFYPCAAHAPLEPMNCTAHVHHGKCDIWVSTQAPERAQEDSAKLLGIPPENVTVHLQLMGGGFGRRLYVDYVLEAAELAKSVAAPVQLLWTRDDDMRCGYFHTEALQRITAGVDAAGKPVAWVHKCAGADHNIGGPLTDTDPKRYAAFWMPWGAHDNPYNFPAIKVDYVPVESPVPAGPWRAVFYPESVFARECMLDEMAHALGRDPLDYRLSLLEPFDTINIGDDMTIERARLRNVLEVTRERAGWSRPLPQKDGRHWGRGLAANVYHGQTHIAQVAEVSVGPRGDLRVHRVVCVVDCGLVLNPSGMAGQVESAVIWGLATALGAENTFRDGRAQQSNFSDFVVTSIADAPLVETHSTGAAERPYGLGEQPVPPIGPAIANAVFAATGKRLRKLPIRATDLA